VPTRRPFFDAHFHVIDSRFPLYENDGFLPAEFTVAQYRARTAALGVVGGAVVSGSFQRFDQDYLLDALARLGPGFVGPPRFRTTSPTPTSSTSGSAACAECGSTCVAAGPPAWSTSTAWPIASTTWPACTAVA
jgi:hypothetical protein